MPILSLRIAQYTYLVLNCVAFSSGKARGYTSACITYSFKSYIVDKRPINSFSVKKKKEKKQQVTYSCLIIVMGSASVTRQYKWYTSRLRQVSSLQDCLD